MEIEKSWLKFIKSGSAYDYLEFVNKSRENEISGRYGSNEVLNRRSCNKGNERGGE